MRHYWLVAILPALSACPRSRYEVPARPIALAQVNSAWDDFNSAKPSRNTLVFSTNRASQGRSFDLWRVRIGWNADGVSIVEAPAPFRSDKGNELGPFFLRRAYRHEGEPDYLVFASDRAGGKGGLDLYSIAMGKEAPDVQWLNTEANEGYWSTADEVSVGYFASNRDGGYDIYEASEDKTVRRMTEVSSNSEDNAPFVFWNQSGRDKHLYMVFASTRPGGKGNRDLWCSRRTPDGSWEPPKPLAYANSKANEFRPIVFHGAGDSIMVFSSEREGGKGGYDLYHAKFRSPF